MQQKGFELVMGVVGQNDVQAGDIGARDDLCGIGRVVDQQIERAAGGLIVEGEIATEGGLTVERFAELQLDRNFAPLTLVQMKSLEPLAFEIAGL